MGVDLKKIKGMRGALYRKIKGNLGKKKKKAKNQLDLPGFQIKEINKIPEFPDFDDISKVDISYPLIEPFAYAHIYWDDKDNEIEYQVIEPELSEEDEKILEKISESLIELVDVELSAIQEENTIVEYLENQISKIIHEFGLNVSGDQYTKIMYYIYRDFVGFNEIEPILQDPNIEDISCDGLDLPIYIVHRKFGSIKTNIIYEDVEYLREFIVKMSQRAGRYVSYAEPVLEGSLPDGSRISATLAGDIATKGPTFTIRKFSEKPFSPTEQMQMKTVSLELLAYYWYIVEHGASMLVVGGVATGKTSFMNTICMFIPPEAKIVSIEDTRELKIPNDHWVPTLARTGFGIPMPSGEKYGGVSLFDLLKQSFRQNPDYVIVGETRGKEAYVMFQGMSSGHPSMSTFHAGSVDTVIKRLTTPPIELSPTLIESLDIITVMIHAREKGKSARRIKEISEIQSVDPKTGEVKTNTVFKWDPANDIWVKMNESVVVKKLVESKGGTMENAQKEIEERKKILAWLYENEVFNYKDVTHAINRYYKEKKSLMKEIGEFNIPEKILRTKTGKLVEESKEEIEKKVESKKETIQAEPKTVQPPKSTEEIPKRKDVPEKKEVDRKDEGEIIKKVEKIAEEKTKQAEIKAIEPKMDIKDLKKSSVLTLFKYPILREPEKEN